MFVLILIFVLAAALFDPLRWIIALVVVAVVRNSNPSTKITFVKMVCTAVFVAVVLEINLLMAPETREFSVLAGSLSVAVSLLIVWLMNLVITWWWSRNTTSI